MRNDVFTDTVIELVQTTESDIVLATQIRQICVERQEMIDELQMDMNECAGGACKL